MSDKYRALLEQVADPQKWAISMADTAAELLAEPVQTDKNGPDYGDGPEFEGYDARAGATVQAEPVPWLVKEHASEFNDYRTKYRAVLDKPKHGGQSLYLHPPAAQVSTCSNCERCQESLNALDDLTEAQGKANAELVEALERLFKSYKALADSGDAGFWSLESLPEGIQAMAALAKYKEQGE